MAPDEEEEGMGTSGEIRRAELPARVEAALSSRLELRQLLSELIAQGQDVEAVLTELQRDGVDVGPIRKELDQMGEAEAWYTAYAEFAKDEVDAQEQRKSSFEQRGLAVITTSGVLGTLLFGLAALTANKTGTVVLPNAAHRWLIASLVLFFLSALTALGTNLPLVYQPVIPDEIRRRLRQKPPGTRARAMRDIAFTRLRTLDTAKRKNSVKGWILVSALALEALAVGCLAVAIAVIL